MSNQQVGQFLDRLASEDDFRRDVGKALQGRSDVGAATVELARDAGFDFTEDEFDRVLGERYGDRELSDAELDEASGGTLSLGGDSLSVAYRTYSGAMLAFPDVCKTPSPGGPVPIPYPTTTTASDTTTKSTKSTG